MAARTARRSAPRARNRSAPGGRGGRRSGPHKTFLRDAGRGLELVAAALSRAAVCAGLAHWAARQAGLPGDPVLLAGAALGLLSGLGAAARR